MGTEGGINCKGNNQGMVPPSFYFLTVEGRERRGMGLMSVDSEDEDLSVLTKHSMPNSRGDSPTLSLKKVAETIGLKTGTSIQRPSKTGRKVCEAGAIK